jgi:flagellar hook assembly protein FlgD
VLRRTLVIAVFLAGLLAAAAHAQSTPRTLLMPGVTYDRDVEFTPHGPVVLNVIEAPKPDGSLFRLAPILSNDAVVATDKLTSIEKGLSGTATVAAVNGDYYNANPGDPRGILIRDGVLSSPPAIDRSSLGIAPDGTLQVARVSFAGIWKGTGQRRALTINTGPGTAGVTLYTSDWGPATPPESQAVVEDVIPQLPATRPNTDLNGTVSQAVGSGGVPIPPGGAVLVARASQAPILQREAPAGTSVFFRMALTPDWSGMTGAIGGGPVLVQNSRAVFRASEAIPASLLNPRGARSAVGQLADGRVVLVTVDGGIRGYSAGMTNFELALALQRLGAVTAMALGSGSVASMAFDGSLLSRPAAPAEPQVSDALAVLYAGVYAPPPSEAVFSPNGDGVAETESLAYRLVRPANVAVTVTGNGVDLTLESGQRPPGLHTFTFTGKAPSGSTYPEGGYRFTVTATDDQGRSSRADRLFALNDTLGSLAVAPASVRLRKPHRGALAVTFDLARASDVDVTVETKSGIVIATVASGRLPAGPQKVLWDGRAATGKLPFGGAYAVRVAATNSVGDVELTQPFTLRRG